MFARLFERLEAEGLQSNLVNILKVLDAHPEIPAINQHHVLLYKADPALIRAQNREGRPLIGHAVRGSLRAPPQRP